MEPQKIQSGTGTRSDTIAVDHLERTITGEAVR